MTFVVRAATADDRAAIDQVITDAFADDGSLVTLFRDLETRDWARGALVAEAHGTVVGYVGLSHAWLDTRVRLLDVWMLSPLATLPACERRGIGTALVAAAIDVADRAGVPVLVLEGSPAYYGSRGFVRASGVGVDRPSRRVPDAACQVALLSAHESWMTGGLVYPDVWWQHDCVGLRDPLLAELEARFGA